MSEPPWFYRANGGQRHCAPCVTTVPAGALARRQTTQLYPAPSIRLAMR
jgi:hypothetical protein